LWAVCHGRGEMSKKTKKVGFNPPVQQASPRRVFQVLVFKEEEKSEKGEE